MRRPDPDWTDARRSDPGITLVQLLAFLAVAIGAVAIACRLFRESPRDGSEGPDCWPGVGADVPDG